MAYSLSYKSAENCQNWFSCVEIITCHINVVFETQCINSISPEAIEQLFLVKKVPGHISNSYQNPVIHVV